MDQETNSPLIRAISTVQPHVVIEELIEHHKDINATERVGDDESTTPLLVAIKYNRKVIPLLMKYPQLDVNRVDASGETPLIKAMYKRNRRLALEAVELLLANPKIDVNKANSIGETALMDAAFLGLDLLPFLAREEIEVNAQDDEGYTALHHAVFEKHHVAIKQLLGDIRTDPSLKNKIGKSAVDEAKKINPRLVLLFQSEILVLAPSRAVSRLVGPNLITEIMDPLARLLYNI